MNHWPLGLSLAPLVPSGGHTAAIWLFPCKCAAVNSGHSLRLPIFWVTAMGVQFACNASPATRQVQAHVAFWCGVCVHHKTRPSPTQPSGFISEGLSCLLSQLRGLRSKQQSHHVGHLGPERGGQDPGGEAKVLMEGTALCPVMPPLSARNGGRTARACRAGM